MRPEDDDVVEYVNLRRVRVESQEVERWFTSIRTKQWKSGGVGRRARVRWEGFARLVRSTDRSRLPSRTRCGTSCDLRWRRDLRFGRSLIRAALRAYCEGQRGRDRDDNGFGQ